ncbi:MAG TPA: S1 family peptidase, partial [Solirubrobacterales bacterium]|nr:S1 family peptidase [Solirubrobacterales bacterium]
MARQSRGAGLTERLEAAQGSAFAGLWFDNQSGEFVLPQLPEAAQAPVESALESAGIGDGAVRTPTVQNSWDELATEQSRLDGRLDMLIQEDVAQTSLEPRTNSVLIVEAASIGSEAKEEVAQIAAAATVAVETRSSNQASFDVSPASCNVAERSCDAPIRGGVYIERTTGAVSCTAGFNATSLQNGSHYVLTAGHCYRAAAAWLARESDGTSQYLGEVEQGVFPGSDYSKIKVANSYWEAGWTSQVTTWGTGETVPITTESASYLGESVCHSGWKSGTSCGVVTALDKTIGYPEGVVYHLTEASGASWCTEPGDSGGPVWGGNTAVGLISGAEKEPACGGHKAYYNEVIEADEAMGVSVGARFTAPFEDSHPVSMRNPTTNQFWIYYRNSDGYLWELYRDPTTGSWANTKVPATEPAAAGSSPVIGRNATTNAQWIYYVGADGYIWELYRNPTTGSWSNTKIPNAQAASPGSSPTNLGDPSAGEAWIYYRGSDGNIWELYRNPINGLWANNKVPAVEPALAGSSPVIGRNSTTNAMWIYYEGVDGHIWELFRNPT